MVLVRVMKRKRRVDSTGEVGEVLMAKSFLFAAAPTLVADRGSLRGACRLLYNCQQL